MSRSRKAAAAAVVVVLGGGLFVDIPSAAAADKYKPGNGVALNPKFKGTVDGTSTNGLTLEVRDLVFETRDLIFTVGDTEGQARTSESNAETDIALSADVLFDFGKSDLTTKANALLDQVGDQIKAKPNTDITITGYTDSKGSDGVNGPLSKARAQSVADALKSRTGRADFAVDGKGASDPVADNTNKDGSDNPAGRALNRRVTIHITTK